jgi:hypothetical protein
MRYIEAPTEYSGDSPALFLAGGISGTGDWQHDLTDLLADSDLVVLNPRRRAFPMDDPNAAEEQIIWEFRHLQRAWAKAFWFPPPTLCPIALFELGKCSESSSPLFVGVDLQYARKRDVEIQLRLARPDVRVVYTLNDLAQQVLKAACDLPLAVSRINAAASHPDLATVKPVISRIEEQP